MISLKKLNMKLPANELSFPLVTHTVGSNVRFGSYGILKSVLNWFWTDWAYR
jgi:hypothetical protein